MKLILFEVFGVKIYGYGAMIAIGIGIAIWLLSKKSKEKGFNEDKIFNMIIFTVIGGILGGKVLYIITELNYVMSDPSIIIREFGNGFVIYGAIIGGGMTLYLYCKKNRWNVLEILDMVVPGVALAQGFGRIGCFLAGCCYGRETNLAIGVEFPKESLAPTGVHLHPTQIYSSIFDFALGIFLIYYAKKQNKNGKVVAAYLIIYSIGRFFVEMLRNDPRGEVGMLSTSQFISIITLIVGLIIYNIDYIKGRMIKGEK